MPFQPTYEISPERQPYTFESRLAVQEGQQVGVLFLHGFMGSPLSSRPLGEYLAQHGLFVHCPLLPGHGHYPDKLHGVSRSAWLAEAEEAFALASARTDELFLAAHSMGNILAAHLITRHGGVRGLSMLAPVYDAPDTRLRYVKYARFFVPWYYPHKSKRESMQHLVRERVLDFDPSVDFDSPEFQAQLPSVSRVPLSGMHEMVETIMYGRKLWPQLTLPVRIYAGDEDVAAPPENSRRILAALASSDKELTVYPDVGHELMRPFEPVHAQVWRSILDFVAEHSAIGLPKPERV